MIIKLKIEGQTIYKKPHATKLQKSNQNSTLSCVCVFVCDFIALEIMESKLAFHYDNFCKFHVPYKCALEARQQFVTERGKKRKQEKKKKLKPKPRPHCLGNKETLLVIPPETRLWT